MAPIAPDWKPLPRGGTKLVRHKTDPLQCPRMMEPPRGFATAEYPLLVESLILRKRSWVNEFGGVGHLAHH